MLLKAVVEREREKWLTGGHTALCTSIITQKILLQIFAYHSDIFNIIYNMQQCSQCSHGSDGNSFRLQQHMYKLSFEVHMKQIEK